MSCKQRTQPGGENHIQFMVKKFLPGRDQVKKKGVYEKKLGPGVEKPRFPQSLNQVRDERESNPGGENTNRCLCGGGVRVPQWLGGGGVNVRVEKTRESCNRSRVSGRGREWVPEGSTKKRENLKGGVTSGEEMFLSEVIGPRRTCRRHSGKDGARKQWNGQILRYFLKENHVTSWNPVCGFREGNRARRGGGRSPQFELRAKGCSGAKIHTGVCLGVR